MTDTPLWRSVPPSPASDEALRSEAYRDHNALLSEVEFALRCRLGRSFEAGRLRNIERRRIVRWAAGEANMGPAWNAPYDEAVVADTLHGVQVIVTSGEGTGRAWLALDDGPPVELVIDNELRLDRINEWIDEVEFRYLDSPALRLLRSVSEVAGEGRVRRMAVDPGRLTGVTLAWSEVEFKRQVDGDPSTAEWVATRRDGDVPSVIGRRRDTGAANLTVPDAGWASEALADAA